jgi:hypothetical protein
MEGRESVGKGRDVVRVENENGDEDEPRTRALPSTSTFLASDGGEPDNITTLADLRPPEQAMQPAGLGYAHRLGSSGMYVTKRPGGWVERTFTVVRHRSSTNRLVSWLHTCPTIRGDEHSPDPMEGRESVAHPHHHSRFLP